MSVHNNKKIKIRVIFWRKKKNRAEFYLRLFWNIISNFIRSPFFRYETKRERKIAPFSLKGLQVRFKNVSDYLLTLDKISLYHLPAIYIYEASKVALEITTRMIFDTKLQISILFF